MATQFDPEQQLRPPDATKGDILVNDGTKWTPLGPGTDGQVLTADSGEATGLNWGSGSGLGDPGGNGVVVRTSINTTTNRTLVAGSSKVSVANGDGVSGNPSIDVTEANLSHANIGGTTAIANGGTGQTTKTAAMDALSPSTTKGDILVDNGTNVVRLGVGSDGQVLTADSGQTEGVAWSAATGGLGDPGANGLVARTALNTTTNRTIVDAGSGRITVTNGNGVSGNPTLDVDESALVLDNLGGTLSISKGGTGQATQTAAFDALAPTTTKGDVIIHNGSDNVRLAVGTDGQALVSRASATNGAQWETISGTVPSGTQGQKLSFGAANVLSARDWVVLAEDYGAVGDGSTDDSPALQSAINALEGTGKTLWLSKTYKITQSLNINQGNFRITGGGTLLNYAGSLQTVDIFSIDGAAVNRTTAAVSVTKANRHTTLTNPVAVTSATSLAVGDLLKFAFDDGTHTFNQFSKIVGVSGTDITLAGALGIPLASGSSTVDEITIPIEDLVIENLTFDGINVDAGATAARGIDAQWTHRCLYRNLKFENFTKNSGFRDFDGYRNHYENIWTENCGSSGESSFFVVNQSNCFVQNINSIRDNGFGPQFSHCMFSHISKVNSAYAGHGASSGRGLKFAASGWNTVTDILVSGAYNNNFAISDGSYRNVIKGIISVDAANNGSSVASGIWFSNQDNDYNILIGVISQGNTNGDVYIGTGDGNNSIFALNRSAVVDNDGGFTNIIQKVGDEISLMVSLTLSNGDNNDVATSNGSYLRVAGPTAAFAITGFDNPLPGRRVTVQNTTTQDMTLKHNVTSTAGNRLEVGRNGADLTLTGVSSATFIYDDTSSIWRLVAVDASFEEFDPT